MFLEHYYKNKLSGLKIIVCTNPKAAVLGHTLCIKRGTLFARKKTHGILFRAVV